MRADLDPRGFPASVTPPGDRVTTRPGLTLAVAGHQCLVVITVTRVEGDGSVLTWTVDTARRQDAERWARLAEQAALHTPPQYEAQPGEAVYRIQAGGLAAMVTERQLDGPLRDLAEAVVAETDGEAAGG